MSLYLLLIFFLSFSFLSVSYLKQSALVESKKQLLETLLTEPAENLVLPESRLTLGPRNAKVKIVVFTDFLCPSCFRFYQFEKDTYEKYGDKVFIAYYNYPLDQSCNPYIDHTAQRSSCTAARAVLAAADLNIFPEFIKKHYSEYEHISVYDKDVALDMAKGLTNPEQLVAKMNSQEVNQVLSRDIELAKGLGIKSTPTIFINGRRITGMPTQEIMETIIDKELGKFNH